MTEERYTVAFGKDESSLINKCIEIDQYVALQKTRSGKVKAIFNEGVRSILAKHGEDYGKAYKPKKAKKKLLCRKQESTAYKGLNLVLAYIPGENGGIERCL